ncbi:TrmB family transcriptional regulator [Haloferax sp. DFSO52]|uniref:TrmB family transcriptional regulator n=1 Tax=Haloferax sp. DFSO52 TaxID=3388505 RepID=UPI003A8894A3
MANSSGQTDTALREELGILGLSDTEIDTYLALLSHGEATTRVIAEDADVTQRSVYSIAERLEKKGLVRVKEHASPTMISALPPEEAIGNLSTRLESITSELGERFNKATSEAPEVNIVKSPETALNRMRAQLREAKKEVYVAIPESKYPEIEADLQDAKERGLLVFLILGEATPPESDSEATSRFATVADVVRTWEARLPFVYAVDDESAMIGDPGFLGGPHGDEEAVSVTQRHLTGSIHGMYLGAYWPAATEVYVTDPDSLPKSFDWFRDAVLHSYLHLQRGSDLWATITTEDGEEFSGKVNQVRQAFVEPSTNDYTLESNIYLQTENGEVSFGGPGAFMEDYEAVAVTLRD